MPAADSKKSSKPFKAEDVEEWTPLKPMSVKEAIAEMEKHGGRPLTLEEGLQYMEYKTGQISPRPGEVIINATKASEAKVLKQLSPKPDVSESETNKDEKAKALAQKTLENWITENGGKIPDPEDKAMLLAELTKLIHGSPQFNHAPWDMVPVVRLVDGKVILESPDRQTDSYASPHFRGE